MVARSHPYMHRRLSRDRPAWTTAQQISDLADFLWAEMGTLVLDQKGIEQDYDFDLDFEPERRGPSPEGAT